MSPGVMTPWHIQSARAAGPTACAAQPAVLVLVMLALAGLASPVGRTARGAGPGLLSLEIDPPGAVRGARYHGVIRVNNDIPGDAVVTVTTLRPASVTDITVERRGTREIAVDAAVSAGAAPGEVFFVTVRHDGAARSGDVILRTVPPSWNPQWRPVAVAPPDTAVADSTQMVILDASHSRHPAGIEAMHFRWWIDGGREVIKGGVATSTTLPRGRHEVVLVAEDAFGRVSRDTMVVHVR